MKRLGRRFGQHGRVGTSILDDRLAFVAPEGLTLTPDIAKKVGMEEESGNMSGVVVGISSYFGLHRPDLWEWLGKVR